MIQSASSKVISDIKDFKKSTMQKSTQPAGTVSNGTAENVLVPKKTDSYVKASDNTSLDQITYSKPKKDYSSEVNALLEDHARQMEDFKNNILSMISKQGEKSNAIIFGLDLTVSNDEIEAAKQSVSSDGEWGVDAVAGRIMDMAYSLAGGDKSKLELLKNAVKDGFKGAGFNPDHREDSQMPEITGQTYDEIMKRFDDWENGTDSSTETKE